MDHKSKFKMQQYKTLVTGVLYCWENLDDIGLAVNDNDRSMSVVTNALLLVWYVGSWKLWCVGTGLIWEVSELSAQFYSELRNKAY